MTRPSTTADSGYMGDRRRGASLGRASSLPTDTDSPKLHLAQISLDSGGYDPGGAYWGHGGYLWEAWDDSGTIYLTGRVHLGPERKAAVDALRAQGIEWPGSSRIDREAAKIQVRECVPEARFYR